MTNNIIQGEPGDGIVIIDRYNLRPKRFLVQGNEMLSLLQSKYGNMVSHRLYSSFTSHNQSHTPFRDYIVYAICSLSTTL